MLAFSLSDVTVGGSVIVLALKDICFSSFLWRASFGCLDNVVALFDVGLGHGFL